VFVGTDALDPVEKVVRVAGSLPVRPFLVRKRNGKGACHVYLRFARGRGRAQHDAKGCCYLGSLTPLQLLAARQAIDRAWPRRCRRPQSKSFQPRLRALRVEYRAARQRLTVLARRAGYRMHGLSIRRLNMSEQAKVEQDQALELQGSPGHVFLFDDYFEGIREEKLSPAAEFDYGLRLMQRICTDFIAFYAGHMKDRIMPVPPAGTPLDKLPRVTAEEERAIATICRLEETFVRLGEARLRLRVARPPATPT
jgi:hypothetical protein